MWCFIITRKRDSVDVCLILSSMQVQLSVTSVFPRSLLPSVHVITFNFNVSFQECRSSSFHCIYTESHWYPHSYFLQENVIPSVIVLTYVFTPGVLNLPAVAVGIFLGGLLMKRYKLSLVSGAQLSFATSFLAYLLLLLQFGTKCDNIPVAGLTVSYNGSVLS